MNVSLIKKLFVGIFLILSCNNAYGAMSEEAEKALIRAHPWFEPDWMQDLSLKALGDMGYELSKAAVGAVSYAQQRENNFVAKYDQQYQDIVRTAFQTGIKIGLSEDVIAENLKVGRSINQLPQPRLSLSQMPSATQAPQAIARPVAAAAAAGAAQPAVSVQPSAADRLKALHDQSMKAQELMEMQKRAGGAPASSVVRHAWADVNFEEYKEDIKHRPQKQDVVNYFIRMNPAEQYAEKAILEAIWKVDNGQLKNDYFRAAEFIMEKMKHDQQQQAQQLTAARPVLPSAAERLKAIHDKLMEEQRRVGGAGAAVQTPVAPLATVAAAAAALPVQPSAPATVRQPGASSVKRRGAYTSGVKVAPQILQLPVPVATPIAPVAASAVQKIPVNPADQQERWNVGVDVLGLQQAGSIPSIVVEARKPVSGGLSEFAVRPVMPVGFVEQVVLPSTAPAAQPAVQVQPSPAAAAQIPLSDQIYAVVDAALAQQQLAVAASPAAIPVQQIVPAVAGQPGASLVRRRGAYTSAGRVAPQTAQLQAPAAAPIVPAALQPAVPVQPSPADRLKALHDRLMAEQKAGVTGAPVQIPVAPLAAAFQAVPVPQPALTPQKQEELLAELANLNFRLGVAVPSTAPAAQPAVPVQPSAPAAVFPAVLVPQPLMPDQQAQLLQQRAYQLTQDAQQQLRQAEEAQRYAAQMAMQAKQAQQQPMPVPVQQLTPKQRYDNLYEPFIANMAQKYKFNRHFYYHGNPLTNEVLAQQAMEAAVREKILDQEAMIRAEQLLLEAIKEREAQQAARAQAAVQQAEQRNQADQERISKLKYRLGEKPVPQPVPQAAQVPAAGRPWATVQTAAAYQRPAVAPVPQPAAAAPSLADLEKETERERREVDRMTQENKKERAELEARQAKVQKKRIAMKTQLNALIEEMVDDVIASNKDKVFDKKKLIALCEEAITANADKRRASRDIIGQTLSRAITQSSGTVTAKHQQTDARPVRRAWQDDM